MIVVFIFFNLCHTGFVAHLGQHYTCRSAKDYFSLLSIDFFFFFFFFNDTDRLDQEFLFIQINLESQPRHQMGKK